MQLEQRYFSIIRRWLWLLILATLAGMIATYWASVREPTVYRATARLIVGPGIDSPNPDLNALRAGGQLMQTYAELPRTGPFLQNIIDELNLGTSREALSDMLAVTANQETQILSIDVTDRDPDQAAAIANSVAAAMVLASPSGSQSPAAVLREQMHLQASKIETEIANTETAISQLQAELPGATDIEQQRLITDRITEERSRLTDAHRTLALLYDSLQAATTNQVKIIEPAAEVAPVVSQLWLKVAIGGLAGLVLSLVAVFGFELLFDNVQSVTDLEQTIDVPILGAIAGYKRLNRGAGQRLVVREQPSTRAAENYRLLGTRLIFSNDPRPLGTVLLSGVQVSEDAGEIAANLAVILAQTGNRVILIDANLHHPTIGDFFGVDNRCGLTDVLTEQAKIPELTTIDWAPGLSVLPSGPVSYSSFALLVSPRMVNLLEQLKQRADIVMISSSPLLAFADSLFLASRVDGTIVIARSGRTRREAVQEAVESLHSVGARIVGTVLNNSQEGHRMGPEQRAERRSQRMLAKSRGQARLRELAADQSQD